MHAPLESASDDERLEPTLGELDARLAEAAKALQSATRALKRAQDAARTGNLREMKRLLAAAAAAADEYSGKTRGAESSWTFAAEEYLASNRYLEELQAAARQVGVEGVRVLDGRLYSYPNIVRVEPRDPAVRIGKKRHSGVRPSHLASILKVAQGKPEQGNLEPVLHAIERCYLSVTGGQLGHAVPLKQIYDLLTPLPGQSREYTLDEFVMDVYRLDLAGPHDTRNKRRFDLPASTSTRGGKGIRFATREGEEKLYSTIRFVAAS